MTDATNALEALMSLQARIVGSAPYLGEGGDGDGGGGDGDGGGMGGGDGGGDHGGRLEGASAQLASRAMRSAQQGLAPKEYAARPGNGSSIASASLANALGAC